jgi:hypothetical protein
MMLDRLIAEFDAQQEHAQSETAWRVEEQRILDEIAFPVWTQCRECIKTECERHSRHLWFEVQPDTDVVVRSRKNRKVLTVEYKPASKSIRYQCGGISRHYSIRVDEERQARIWDPAHDVFKSPEDVADELLALIFT